MIATSAGTSAQNVPTNVINTSKIKSVNYGYITDTNKIKLSVKL